MTEILDEQYWNNRYINNETGWDLRQVSPPLKAYFDQLENKNSSILIPGCGNAYEAIYLAEQGFTNITLIDIAASLVEALKIKLKDYHSIQIIHQNFFNHTNRYDLIVEQTFFCALHPSLRNQYVQKTYTLLNTNGKLVGVLFKKYFETDGPPFGGTKEEYEALLSTHFHINSLTPCYNSFNKRAGTELFFNCKKY